MGEPMTSEQMQHYVDTHPEFRAHLQEAIDALDRGEGVTLPEFGSRVRFRPQAAEKWRQLAGDSLEVTHGDLL